MRADLYLHHIRVFISRSLATQACQKGNVHISGQNIKPSRILKQGEILDVERGELKLILKVLDFPLKRVGAPMVGHFMENLTPEENYHHAAAARKEREAQGLNGLTVKPDKKQLRQIREWMEQSGNMEPAEL